MQRYNFVGSWAIPKSDASLFLVQFYRQSVGVAEEHKLLAGIFVRAYGLMLYALAVKFADSFRKVVHLESKVAQTGCFYLFILFALFVQDTGKALSPISTDAMTIDVATSVIGYGLL